jgi:hypothetical protein
LLISNPGEVGADNYCNGVNVDVLNYKKFLTSPLGGAWTEDEIIDSDRPSKSYVKSILQTLKNNDYLLIIFCGHGYYSSNSKTVLELKKDNEISSDELKIGIKQTIILDCCRVMHPEEYVEDSRFSAMLKAKSDLNRQDCRRYYEKKISEAPLGLVVMYGCDVNETSGESSSKGGYYSSNLILSAEKWFESDSTDTSNNYNTLSVVKVHSMASEKVTQISGKTQNPQIDKPRSEPYYPFAIIA